MRPAALDRALPALALLAAAALPAAAQEDEARPEAQAPAPEPAVRVEMGVTLTSRFIYRGLDLGDAPQVQPRISVHAGGLEVSLWASHPIAASADDDDDNPRRDVPETYREVLAWARYDFDVGVGTLSPYVQNHYNPNAGRLFDFAGGGEGAHVLQAQLFFVGDEAWAPVDLMAGWAFHNDPENSVYLEGGYRFSLSALALRAFVGGTPARSPFNGTDRAALTVVGLSASRRVPLSSTFSLPVSAAFVVNPHTEKPFASFSISL